MEQVGLKDDLHWCHYSAEEQIHEYIHFKELKWRHAAPAIKSYCASVQTVLLRTGTFGLGLGFGKTAEVIHTKLKEHSPS